MLPAFVVVVATLVFCAGVVVGRWLTYHDALREVALREQQMQAHHRAACLQVEEALALLHRTATGEDFDTTPIEVALGEAYRGRTYGRR